jgi:hypothetical protein
VQARLVRTLVPHLCQYLRYRLGWWCLLYRTWKAPKIQCNQTATVQDIKFVKDVDFSNFSLPLAKTAGWVLLNEQLYYLFFVENYHHWFFLK